MKHEKICRVCGMRFTTTSDLWVTCGPVCSAANNKKTRSEYKKNLRLRKSEFTAAANKPLRSATSDAYTDDMAGQTIVRTTTRGNFVGLPVVVLRYESLNIGGKPTTIQHSANAWVGAINGSEAQIIGPRIDFTIALSKIQRI